MKTLFIILGLLVLLETYLQIQAQPRRYVSGGKGVWVTEDMEFSTDETKAVSFHFLSRRSEEMFLKLVSDKHPDSTLKVKKMQMFTRDNPITFTEKLRGKIKPPEKK